MIAELKHGVDVAKCVPRNLSLELGPDLMPRNALPAVATSSVQKRLGLAIFDLSPSIGDLVLHLRRMSAFTQLSVRLTCRESDALQPVISVTVAKSGAMR